MSKGSKAAWFTGLGIALVIVSIVSITCFLLNGQTTVTGQNGSITKSQSLSCEATDVPYQFLSYDHAVQKTAKINASFQNDTINSISLIYKLYYDDAKSAESSKTVNSSELNVYYGKDDLPANAFSKTVSVQDKTTVISLYADSSDFNDKTSKYFMADGLGKNSKIDSFAETYEKQGFNCEKNN